MGGRAWRRVRVWSAVSVVGLGVMGFFLVGAMMGFFLVGAMTYAQAPPNQGEHLPVWQRCGFYPTAIGDEHAVHSLGHGAVWVTYRPELSEDDIGLQRELARRTEDVLVSRDPTGLSAPVVVSAWGWGVRLDPFGWTKLDDAVQTARAARPPETNGGCEVPDLLTGATGAPELS